MSSAPAGREAALAALLLSLAGCTSAFADKPGDAGMSAAEDKELAGALGDLSDEHPARFGPAIRWLVEHPDRSRPVLVEWVKKGDDDFATGRAYEVLGRIGDPADVAPLAAALGAARTAPLAEDAARGLRFHPAAAARDALVAATASPAPHVAIAAATELGERREEAARPALEKLLAHDSWKIRYRAVNGLIALGAAGSKAALEERRKVEPNAEVKSLIRKALRARAPAR